MEPSDWVSIGALLVAAASFFIKTRHDDRAADVAEDDLSLRRLQAALEAGDRRITDLERRLELAERHYQRCDEDRIRLRTFIVSEGLTPPPHGNAG